MAPMAGEVIMSSALRTAACRQRMTCRRAAALMPVTQARLPSFSQRLYSTESTSIPPPSTTTRDDVLERYRSQLENRAQQEGVADIYALRETYTTKIQELRRRDSVLPQGAAMAKEQAAATPEASNPEPVAEPAQAAQQAQTAQTAENMAAPAAETPPMSPSPSAPSSRPGARPLSSLLDLDKTRVLPAEELTAIWRLRFANDPLSLCAVIPAATYAAMEAAARARPQFVLPVPHPEQGAEIHYMQWTFDDAPHESGGGGTSTSTVLFTQLAEYKLRGEFAQPHTTVTHYTDLATDCGVVLMQGQVAEGRGVSADDAQWLVMCLQRFYGAWAIPGITVPGAQAGGSITGGSGFDEGARARRMLLQWFAAGDPQFSIEKLLEEVEKFA